MNRTAAGHAAGQRRPDLAAMAVTAADIAERTGVPAITAFIMAADHQSAEQATAMVEGGVPVPDALATIGSYSRIGWLLDMAEQGHIDRRAVLTELPRLWPMADPDDTDPRMLLAWYGAWRHNRRRIIIDGEALPPGRTFFIFRGQGRDSPLGIAWTLRMDVALKFAMGAGVRVPGGVPSPVIYQSRVHRRQIMAYLHRRGEAEVIIDPAMLYLVTVAGE